MAVELSKGTLEELETVFIKAGREVGFSPAFAQRVSAALVGATIATLDHALLPEDTKGQA